MIETPTRIEMHTQSHVCSVGHCGAQRPRMHLTKTESASSQRCIFWGCCEASAGRVLGNMIQRTSCQKLCGMNLPHMTSANMHIQ
eukprot:4149682-Amphidinium_carterae.1